MLVSLGIVSMSRCCNAQPEMQLQVASCMCEVLPLLATREASLSRSLRPPVSLCFSNTDTDTDDEVDDDVVAGKHANYAASLAAAAAAAAPIVPVEWRPCLCAARQQHRQLQQQQ